MKIIIALIKAAEEQSREGQPPQDRPRRAVVFERTCQWSFLQQEMSGDICRHSAHSQAILEDEAYCEYETARTEEEKVDGKKGEEDPVRHYGCCGRESHGLVIDRQWQQENLTASVGLAVEVLRK